MPNPLLSRLGKGQATGMQSGNAGRGMQSQKSVVEMFREFKAGFKGDPNQALNDMISSGKVTQAQVENAKLLANMVVGRK